MIYIICDIYQTLIHILALGEIIVIVENAMDGHMQVLHLHVVDLAI